MNIFWDNWFFIYGQRTSHRTFPQRRDFICRFSMIKTVLNFGQYKNTVIHA